MNKIGYVLSGSVTKGFVRLVILIKKYFFNCFLLTIPILIWNYIFTNKLPKAFQPEIYWKNIPSIIIYEENI
jgi:hypothetical protein